MEIGSKDIKLMLIKIAQVYLIKRDELAKLDSVIGDGDHGITMARGAKEGKQKLEEMSDTEPINEYFKSYGRTLVDKMGGAMGPIFGSIFTEFGKCSKGKELFTKEVFVESIEKSTAKVMDFGGAKLGDKTMVDAMIPTMEAVKEALTNGKDFNEITQSAEEAAYLGVQNTIPLIAKKGRSKFLQDKSKGHQDAGATSYYYLIKTINEFINSL